VTEHTNKPPIDASLRARAPSAEQLAKLIAWSKEHYFADCNCVEAPCEFVEIAEAIGLLAESYAKAVTSA